MLKSDLDNNLYHGELFYVCMYICVLLFRITPFISFLVITTVYHRDNKMKNCGYAKQNFDNTKKI